jgi:SAM-dependent methyltransferase
MRNPWLDIVLADYEGHMGLPEVAQAELLADVFGVLLVEHAPRSVAVLGCAGGNGFDRISPAVTHRVVGVDLNPTFIDAASARFDGRFRVLELVVADLQTDEMAIESVDFVYAALVFEYMDLPATFRSIRSLLRRGGVVGTVVQLPTSGLDAVTPSAYSSVQLLAPSMRLVSPEELRDCARAHDGKELTSYSVASPVGKQFQVQVFGFNAVT